MQSIVFFVINSYSFSIRRVGVRISWPVGCIRMACAYAVRLVHWNDMYLLSEGGGKSLVSSVFAPNVGTYALDVSITMNLSMGTAHRCENWFPFSVIQIPPQKSDIECSYLSGRILNQYTAQVDFGRGDNRATSYFLPELFSEGSKAVKWTMDVLPFDELSQVRKIPFLRYLKNRINFNNSRRKLRIIPFFAELFAL